MNESEESKYVRRNKKIRSYSYKRNGKRVKVKSHNRKVRERRHKPISRAKAERIYRVKSRVSKGTDWGKEADQVFKEPNETWAENPEKYDVRGIDN